MDKTAGSSAPALFNDSPIRLLISGGPGSGCTSTAEVLGRLTGVAVLDSDSFFHKPTDPPFQEQNTPEERRALLTADLRAQDQWILSGSVALWGVEALNPTHGVLLSVSPEIRLERLKARERKRFGLRVEEGGDMRADHLSFLLWAAGYEVGEGAGRNLRTDRAFLVNRCPRFLEIRNGGAVDQVAEAVLDFLRAADPAAGQ